MVGDNMKKRKRKIKRFCRIIMTKQEKAEGEHMRKVYRLIRQLGMTSKYKGYYYVVDAVEMAQKIYERPVKVTKDIYPVIARKYKSTPSNVEHNIRTLVNLCWMNHKDTLEEMAGCTMADKPTNSEFIDILVYYLRYSDKD